MEPARKSRTDKAPAAGTAPKSFSSTRTSRFASTKATRFGKEEPEEEKKAAAPKTGLFTEKPSARLTNVKVSDPFASKKKHKTNFGYVYQSGAIPCRINHGSINNRLQWDSRIESNVAKRN